MSCCVQTFFATAHERLLGMVCPGGILRCVVVVLKRRECGCVRIKVVVLERGGSLMLIEGGERKGS